MKIAVLGANGGTGVELLKQGLECGHEMVALVRRPESIELRHARLAVRQVNAHDARSIAEGILGAGVVVSSIGGGGLMSSRKAAGVLSSTAGPIIDAVRQETIARLVVISSVGVVDDPHEEFVYRHVIKRILAPYYVDMANMEKMFAASGLSVTLVRPPFLTDKPMTGKYRVETDNVVTKGYRLSRADLAHFILDEISANRFAGKAVGVAY